MLTLKDQIFIVTYENKFHAICFTQRIKSLRNDTLIKYAFIRRNFIFQQGKKPACRQAGVDNAGHWRGFLTL